MSQRNRQVEVAARHLKSEGMDVLDRAWKGTEGELDLVAEDRGTLVVVVLVPNVYTFALSTPRKRRLRRLAVAWLTEHGRRYDRIRVDVVSVTLLAMGQSNLEHVRAVDS